MEKKINLKYNPNADLVKVVAMVLIVMCHAISYSTNLEKDIVLNTISPASIIGDNLFVLATGYLASDSEKVQIKYKKLFALITKADIYCWIIFFILFVFGQTQLTTESRYDLFPVLTGGYWFITVYILLYLFKPFLDAFLRNCSQEIEKKCIISGIMVFSVFSIIPYSLEIGTYHGYSLPWFLFLYMLGHYFNKYGFRINIGVGMGISVLIWGYKVAIRMVPFPKAGIIERVNDLNNVLWLFVSVTIFHLLIEKVKIKRTTLLKAFASSSLGVYLIHMQPSLKFVLWTKVFRVDSKWKLFLAVAIVYCTCVVIDLIIMQIIQTLKRWKRND